MPTKANELLSYQGNAAQGANDTGGSPPALDLREGNSMLSQLAAQNFQKNRDIWYQKKQDRDRTLEAISADQLQIGAVHPNDLPVMQQKINDIKKFVLDRHGDVQSNPNDWIQLNGMLANFKDSRTLAQSRLDSFQKGKADAAQELDPTVQKKKNDWYDKQISTPVTQLIDPYQQQMDYDYKVVAVPIPTMSKLISQTPDGVKKTYQDEMDLDKGYRMYQSLYHFGDKQMQGLQVHKFLENFYGHDGSVPPDQVLQNIRQTNNTLDQIALDKGYDISNQNALPVYLRHITPVRDTNGTIHSPGNAWDDWFKIQAAGQYQKKQVYEKYDEDAMKLKKLNDDILTNQSERAKNYAEADKYKADADKDQQQQQKQQMQQINAQQVWSSLVNKVTPSEMTLKHPDGTSETVKTDAIYLKDLPPAMRNIGGMAWDPVAQKYVPQEIKPFVKGGKEFWGVRYSDPSNGQQIEPRKSKFWQDQYKTNLKAYPNATFDDFLKSMIKQGFITGTFVGKEGTADMNSVLQSMIGLNNQISSGKEQPIYSNGSTVNTGQ